MVKGLVIQSHAYWLNQICPRQSRFDFIKVISWKIGEEKTEDTAYTIICLQLILCPCSASLRVSKSRQEDRVGWVLPEHCLGRYVKRRQDEGIKGVGRQLQACFDGA